MRVLDEEPLKFFEDFLYKARFRRVMYGEYFDGEFDEKK